MQHIVIDNEKCIGCGQCVKDCGTNVLYLENGKTRAKDDGCVECGHCFAVCPKEAISMPEYDCSDCGKVGSFSQFDEDEMLLALKSRRTIRHLKDHPITEEQIHKIIEAGRYSPTATNLQNVRYTVLTGNTMREFEAVCIAKIRKVIGLAKPFLSAAKTTKIEDDFLFHHAPAAILISAKKSPMDHFGADVNGALATAHMETQAESMGLGVLVSGFTIISLKLSGEARRIIGLEKGEKPVACLVIGYPAIKHRRIPPRKEAIIRMLN